MSTQQDFTNAGFTVVGTEELPQFGSLRDLQDYIRNYNLDDEETLQNHSNPLITKIIVQTLLTLPIDEKTNGYGLNFVGRNFARAKYAQKTDKELRLNRSLSVAETTTQNLVLKGDNLDSLKMLKNHYTGKIKCIYIDPPYNTTSDEFVYPDKFDKEETEVLGMANLSDDDFARMDFSFKSKKSHNGWLAFMYPRLLLARDLLSKDGVIFISIDDNEQANLKLLCDEIFGEENFRNIFSVRRYDKNLNLQFIEDGLHSFNVGFEYILCYSRTQDFAFYPITKESDEERQNSGYWKGFWNDADRPSMRYDILGFTPPNGQWKWNADRARKAVENYKRYLSDFSDKMTIEEYWRKEGESLEFIRRNMNGKGKNQGVENWISPSKGKLRNTNWTDLFASKNVPEVEELFDFPKNPEVIKNLITGSSSDSDIILDFFAGSGTTGHAVMQLNAEDGGNRKFILCQIDEPIDKKKEAYKFCVENGLEPVISSITIERLKRAGEKIKNSLNHDLPDFRDAPDLFSDNNQGNHINQENHSSDIGFKVFDSVAAPKLEVQDGQIIFPEINDDALSRIYNMMFTVGLDEPTQTPETVVENCIYKIGNHYYVTNSEKINADDFANAIKNGKVFIDGWTASLNGTLQHYKADVKIVF
ncbi:MAG: site-specific DNA-methyltransferase [Edaphocola sp.]